MRSNQERSRIIEILSETPYVRYACKKVGISHSAFYRWMKSNKDFKADVERVLKEGHENICEIAEMSLVKNIKNGDLGSIRFYLQNNDSKYISKRSIYVEPTKPNSMSDPYGKCHECGNQRQDPDQSYSIMLAMKNLGMPCDPGDKNLFIKEAEESDIEEFNKRNLPN